jgi:hypothetical protein
MLVAGVPALLQPTEDAAARLEQEVAEQQRKVEQLQRRDKVSQALMYVCSDLQAVTRCSIWCVMRSPGNGLCSSWHSFSVHAMICMPQQNAAVCFRQLKVHLYTPDSIHSRAVLQAPEQLPSDLCMLIHCLIPLQATFPRLLLLLIRAFASLQDYYATDVQKLHNDSTKALALSPGYQPNKASLDLFREMEQTAAQKMQQRLQHEQELLQQRTAAGPAATRAAAAAETAAPAAIEQQLQQAAARLAAAGSGAAAAVPRGAPGPSKQQQQQAEDSDEVICLSSGDEDDEQQQHVEEEEEGYSEEEGSGYDEDEGEEEEGSEEEEEEEEEGIAAGVDRLQLDRWLGEAGC